jgi:hypothetical protein
MRYPEPQTETFFSHKNVNIYAKIYKYVIFRCSAEPAACNTTALGEKEN